MYEALDHIGGLRVETLADCLLQALDRRVGGQVGEGQSLGHTQRWGYYLYSERRRSRGPQRRSSVIVGWTGGGHHVEGALATSGRAMAGAVFDNVALALGITATSDVGRESHARVTWQVRE